MRTALVIALVAMSACKKNQEPDVAAEPAAKVAADPASTVTINVRGNSAGFERVRVTCKELGPETKLVGALEGGVAVVSGLQGECKAELMPGEIDLGFVVGGSQKDCIGQDDGSVACK